MTERVYIHVGPHKTGTTYVQGLLTVNHDRIAEQGVLFPRQTFKAQSRAVREAMNRGVMPKTGRAVKGEWKKLRAETDRWAGPAAIISHEMIGSASETETHRLVRRLKGFDVHVVYTARDLARVAPAMWQTGLRSTRSFTWEEYASSLRRPDDGQAPWGKRFWREQDAAALLLRWNKHLPRENLHVVTVPRPGNPPELLWQRFCSVLGLDPSEHDLVPPRSNPSLGTAESELIRRINEALSAGDVPSTVWLSRTRWLGRELETRADMAKYTLPAEDLGWVTERAARIITELRYGGYDIVGDLDDLVPQPVAPERARHPSDTSPEAVLEVAIDIIRRMTLAARRPADPGEPV